MSLFRVVFCAISLNPTHLQDRFTKPNEYSLERIKEPQGQNYMLQKNNNYNWQAAVYSHTSIC